MAWRDFLQMSPENIAKARNTTWGSAIAQDFNPRNINYQGFQANPANVAQSSRVGLGSYINQGLRSLMGKFQGGSNVGGATSLMRKIAMSPFGKVAGAAFSLPAAAAYGTYKTPAMIDYLTKRDPNATQSSLFGIDLTRNANEQAALPDVGANAWSEMGPIPDDGVVPPIKNINKPLPSPYQDRIMRMASGVEPDFDRGNIDNRFSFNPLNWGIAGMMKKMIAPMSPEKRAEVEAILGSADKSGWGNIPGTGLRGNVWQGSGGRKINVVDPVTGAMIVRDKNLQSAFGSKTIEEMIQKKEDWAKGQFEKYGDEWDEDEHRGLSKKLYNYYKQKGLIDQWKGGADVPTDDISKGTTIGEITGGTTPVPEGAGTPGSPTYGTKAGAEATYDRPGAKGSPGYHWAQGGRVGLYAGGDPVIPEDETEDVFELMRDQNIPISEQVEGDPFQMRIQELMGKGLSYDDAYDIAEMEFQDLFAEGSEQDQGLASLV